MLAQSPVALIPLNVTFNKQESMVVGKFSEKSDLALTCDLGSSALIENTSKSDGVAEGARKRVPGKLRAHFRPMYTPLADPAHRTERRT
jgi:hypothetical protein